MAKRRAEDIASDISGVSYVQNNLRVRQQGSTAGEGMVGMTGLIAGTAGAAIGAAGTDVAVETTETSESAKRRRR